MKLSNLLVFSMILTIANVLSAAELKVGDAAPDFSLVGTDGKTYKLSDFKGKKAVVLAWFPRADTPGCTKECTSFKNDGPKMRDYDVAYFTASNDPPEKNKAFADKLGVDYPILSDPTSSTAKSYGVLNMAGTAAQRWTFYIGADGKILYIDKMVKTDSHGADVATKLAELGVAKKK
jgi:thioredoxin-dependent peroxiredoxin